MNNMVSGFGFICFAVSLFFDYIDEAHEAELFISFCYITSCLIMLLSIYQ
jgi:hypothetical protein